MAIVTANITWSFVPGSLSTLVEYKQAGSSVWITPTSPNNPTTNNTYPLTITENVTYDVRLTTNGIRCSPKSTTFQIFKAQGACCPAGYTLSTDESYCYQINTTAATPPSNPQTSVAQSSVAYSICGSWIYNPGFNVNGTGTNTQISLSNNFWKNGPGDCFTGGTTTDGPMNRTALWTSTHLPSQQIGFSVCINVTATKTYYVGIGCDNFGTIRVNGTTVLQQDASAMDIQFFGFVIFDGQSPYRAWNIYPITLNAGTNVVEVIGNNSSDTAPTNVAAVGIEIYDNTPAQIAAATSYAGLNVIFSSAAFVGQPVQVGSDGIGYSCPTGYSLVLCSGPAHCTQTLTTGTIPCTTTTTTTTTSTSTTTTTTNTTTTTSTTTTTTTT